MAVNVFSSQRGKVLHFLNMLAYERVTVCMCVQACEGASMHVCVRACARSCVCVVIFTKSKGNKS